MTTALVSSPRIPATLLYWGRLTSDTSAGPTEAQDYRFERLLPLPVDHLHLIRTPLPDGGMVLVGIEPERLRTHLAQRNDVTPTTWELLPDHLPEHLATTVPEAQRDQVLAHLNLLQGIFEPQPRRNLRLRMTAVFACGLLLAAILVVIGIERRAAQLRQYADQVTNQTRSLMATIIPPQAGERHPELRLTMELRRLEQAAAGTATSGVDAVAALSALWRVWPTDLRVQIEALAAMQDRLVIRGALPSLADAERMAQACRTLDPSLRLRAQPLQAQTSERGASFLLTLVYQDAAGGRP